MLNGLSRSAHPEFNAPSIPSRPCITSRDANVLARF